MTTRRLRIGTRTLTPAGARVVSGARIRSLVLALIVSLPGTGHSAPLPDDDYAALARATVDYVIIPAYESYARATKRLGPAIERHCLSPAAEDATAVHAAFGEAVDAWQRAWPFGFGPVMEGAGRARIAFWPGRRSSAARQIRAVLRTRDSSLLDPKRLAGKSVAVKDLQALERLLFEVPRDPYTCGFAHAIALYQSEIAAEILAAWTREGGFRHTALAAGGGNDLYEDDSEVARDLMRSLTESLEAVVAQKLAPPLGGSAETSKPKRAESWRSGRSLRNVVLNLESMRALVEAPGGFADLVTGHGEAVLAESLREGFAMSVSAAESVTLPLRDAVTNPGERAKLLDLLQNLRALRALVTGPLSRTTGILVGFNSQDGD